MPSGVTNSLSEDPDVNMIDTSGRLASSSCTAAFQNSQESAFVSFVRRRVSVNGHDRFNIVRSRQL